MSDLRRIGEMNERARSLDVTAKTARNRAAGVDADEWPWSAALHVTIAEAATELARMVREDRNEVRRQSRTLRRVDADLHRRARQVAFNVERRAL